VVASSSICGLPFLSGWVSKDAILEAGFNNTVGLGLLVLFYLGVALTLLYSIRLVRLLFVSCSQFTSVAVSYSCTGLIKVPIFLLLSLSVLQGSSFSFNCSWSPSFLGVLDKLFLWVLVLVSYLVFSYPNKLFGYSPFLYLSCSTSFLRCPIVSASRLHLTEVSELQGCGLASLPSTITGVRLGSHVLIKLLIMLVFCFFLF